MRVLFDRYTQGGKYNRNRGYIAVAHQLCLIGYVLWKKNQDYQETPPPRPGSRQQVQLENTDGQKPKSRRLKIKEDSRPGTGQPQAAMATQVAQ